MKSRQDGLDVCSLIYVSRSRLSPPDDIGEMSDLVATSQGRNAALGVTGALIYTQRHFAQLLEGPADAVDELMASITRDARHEHVRVVDRTVEKGRRFPGWSLAYWGSATFVDHLITALLPGPDFAIDQAAALARLYQAMVEFALQSEGGPPIGRSPSPHG